jgi:hypothetical protein
MSDHDDAFLDMMTSVSGYANTGDPKDRQAAKAAALRYAAERLESPTVQVDDVCFSHRHLGAKQLRAEAQKGEGAGDE